MELITKVNGTAVFNNEIVVNVDKHSNAITLAYELTNDGVVAGASGITYDIFIKHSDAAFNTPLLDGGSAPVTGVVLTPVTTLDGYVILEVDGVRFLDNVTYVIKFYTDSSAGTTTLNVMPNTSYIPVPVITENVAFITQWKTTSDAESIILPFNDTNNFVVDWGDGNTETITTADPTHEYATAGEYIVSCTGTATAYGSWTYGDQLKCIDIINWGSMGITDWTTAFAGGSGLTNITATDSLICGGEMAFFFYDCTELLSVDVSGFNVSATNNPEEMFNGCNKLISLDMSTWDTSNFDNLKRMFSWMYAMTSIDVSNFNTDKVTNMFGTFSGMTGLTTIDISSFNTSLVTSMQSLFDTCTSLETINMTGIDTSEVLTMSGMFSQMSAITVLDLSEFDTAKVTNMSRMFSGCKIPALSINHFDTTLLEDSNSMFQTASNITTLDLSSWTNPVCWRQDTMFSGMTALTTLTLTNFGTSANTLGFTNMFSNCDSLISLDLTSFDTQLVERMFGMFTGCLLLETVDLSSFVTTSLWDLRRIGYTSPNLSLDLSGFDITGITELERTFEGGGLTTEHYDALLLSWSVQTVTDGPQSFHGGSTQYTETAAHNTLDNTKGWIMVDGGPV